MKRVFTPWVLALVLAAVVFRLAFYVYALRVMPASTDEAFPSLMAMHILKGEHPIFYWGQTYMGTQESYFLAALAALFGPGLGVMRIYALLFGFVYVAASVLLAARVYNRETGLLTLVLLVVPVPYVTMCGAMIAPDNYLALTALGSFALVLLHELCRDDAPASGRTAKFAALGFLLGYTLWLHILVLSYIGVVALCLFLKDKFVFLRKEAWIGALAFAAGAFPLLAFNLAHHGATFRDVGRPASWHHSWMFFQDLYLITLHFLVGAKVMFTGDKMSVASLPLLLALALGAVWAGILSLVVAQKIKPLLRLARLSVKPWDGTTMLLALAGAALFMFCRSFRSGWHNVRYVLPIVSVLPVLMAYGLAQVRRWSTTLFAAMLAVVLASQAWGNVILARGWRDPHVMVDELHLPDTRNLIAFLDRHGIRHAYAHFWTSYRLTYETREHVICAEPYNERFPFNHDVKFLDSVDNATNVAYIWHPAMRFCKGRFEPILALAGGSWQSATVDSFTVYYDFKPPYGEATLRELPRDGWQATASAAGGKACLAIDGKLDTHWRPPGPQTNGMTYTLDIGTVRPLCRVWIYQGNSFMDFPRQLQVEVSADGQAWTTVRQAGEVGGCVYWEGTHPRFDVYGDHFTVAFAPTLARFVRLTQTASDPRFSWTIAELKVDEAE